MNPLTGIYEKKGNILCVQVDHLSGEMIGTAIEDLYEAGAMNVQVIPTVTKKNRPGHLFFIDVPNGRNSAVESVILDLGSSGWHLFETRHRHVATEIRNMEVAFETPEGPFVFNVQVKIMQDYGERIHPEHSSCLALRETLRKKGVRIPLKDLYLQIIRQINIDAPSIPH